MVSPAAEGRGAAATAHAPCDVGRKLALGLGRAHRLGLIVALDAGVMDNPRPIDRAIAARAIDAL